MEHSGLDFVLIETWTAIRRNSLITLAAIGNITICLAILGAFALGTVNLDYLASLQAKGAFITVYLQAEADGSAIKDELYGDERVKETKFVPKEDVLLEWAQMTGTDPSELEIIGNPYSDIIRVWVVNPKDLPALRAREQNRQSNRQGSTFNPMCMCRSPLVPKVSRLIRSAAYISA